MIANIPDHPDAMYVSQPVYTIPPKLVKDTVYMPSLVAERLFGKQSIGRSVSARDEPVAPGDR
jgi:hypothetical protein